MIEVIVASLILAAISFAFIQFLNNAQKGQKNLQNSVDFDILKTSLNMVFNTKACDSSLYAGTGATAPLVSFSIPSPLVIGQNLFPTGTTKLSISEIRHGSSTVVKLGETLQGGLKIEKLEITDAIFDGTQLMGPNPATDTYNAFSSMIVLEASRLNASASFKTLKTTLSVRLLAQASGANAGRIEKCSSPLFQVGFESSCAVYKFDSSNTHPDVTLCCKINTTTGATSCASQAVTAAMTGDDDWSAGGVANPPTLAALPWVALVSPPFVAATVQGHYSLHCRGGDRRELAQCCRQEKNSGIMECKNSGIMECKIFAPLSTAVANNYQGSWRTLPNVNVSIPNP